MSIIFTPGQLKRRAELYHQLSSMVSAGVSLINAVEQAVNNPPSYTYRRPLLEALQHLQAGHNFSDSFAKVGDWLPKFDLALLAAGENTGRIDRAFQLLSRYYDARATLLRQLIVGMIYTMLTLHVFLLIFPLGLMVNALAGFFNGHPDPRYILAFLFEKFAVFGLLWGTIFLFIFAGQAKHGESWRAMIESFCNFIPWLGKARRDLAIARFSVALESLISAGVPVISAFELAAAASGSPALNHTISQWRPHLESGSTPADLIRRTQFFPEMFANLYSTGEISGQQDTTLLRLYHYYEEEGFRRMRTFITVFNALLYLAIVLLVGFSVVSFYVKRYRDIMNQF